MPLTSRRRRLLSVSTIPAVLVWLLVPAALHAQVTAQVPDGIKPPWDKGIQAINQINYWNAMDCGKQGGENPACVFYDTDLCKNTEFTLAMFTPYKQVAYTVWQAVRQKKPAPTPSYVDAQRTRVVLGVKPLHGAQNPITGVTIKRGGATVQPATKTLDGGGGTFIFEFAPFAPTADISIEFAGKSKSVSCAISKTVLARLR